MMTPHPSPIDLAVLGRYLDGTAAPTDRAAVEAWMGADLERRAAMAALREAWAADALRLTTPYAEDAGRARFAMRFGFGAVARLAPRLAGVGRPRRVIAAAIVTTLVGACRAGWIGRGRTG